MKRTVFKWTLGISIAVLILIPILMVFLFAAGGVFMAMLSAGTGMKMNTSVTFGDFYSNFVGSPLFYVTVIARIVLVGSIVGLILTKKAK